MANYGKEIARSSVLFFISLVISAVLGYVLRIYFAKNLSIEEFGLIYTTVSFFSFFGIFYQLNLNTTIVKFISEAEAGNKRELKWTIFVSSVFLQVLLVIPILILILIFKDAIINEIFKNSLSYSIFIFGLLYLILTPLDLIQAYFRGTKKNFLYASYDVVKNVSYFGIAFLLFSLLKSDFKIFSLILAYIGFYLLILILLMGYAAFKRINFFKLIKFKVMKKLFLFSIPLSLSTVLSSQFGKLDVIILTYFTDLQQVGLYNAVVPTVRTIWNFLGVVSITLLPIASELLYKKENSRLSLLAMKLTKYIVIFSVPMILFFVLYSKEFLNLVFGGEFAVAGISLAIFSFAILLMNLQKVYSAIIIASGDVKSIFKISFVGYLIGIIAQVVLTPVYKLNGLLIASVGTMFLILILLVVRARKIIKVKINSLLLIKFIFSSVIFLFLAFYLKSFSFFEYYLLNIIFVLIITSLIYFGSLILLRVISVREIKQIISVRNKN